MSAQPHIHADTARSPAQLHAALAETVLTLTACSEGEVLEIGRRIGHMVEIAEAHAEALEALRGALRLDQLDTISAGQQGRVTVTLGHIQACLGEQLTLVEGLAELAAHIAATYTALRRGIQTAGLLNVYVRVESANLTNGRSTVQSLAEKLGALSVRMDSASEDVRVLVRVLHEALPILQGRLREGLSHCEGLRHAMSAHGIEITRTTQELSEALGQRFSNCMDHVRQAITASHRALSAMQFQDPMIQSIQRLDPLTAEARRSAGEPEATPIAYGAGFASDAAHALVGDDLSVGAGEALLF